MEEAVDMVGIISLALAHEWEEEVQRMNAIIALIITTQILLFAVIGGLGRIDDRLKSIELLLRNMAFKKHVADLFERNGEETGDER